jgi:hypothetical protein
MNDKVIRYCPWPLHTQVWAHIPIFIVTCVYHTSTQHITYVHTHAHAQSRCAEELCTVLEHRVKAVSLCSCSNSHFQSGLGRKGCCPASSPVSTSTLQEGLAVSASAPRPPHQSLLNLVLTTRLHSDSVPITHPSWNPREKTNSDTQPALSELFPASDPIPPTLTLSWLHFTLENDRLLSLVDSSPALL